MKLLFAVLISWFCFVSALGPKALEQECDTAGESVAFLQVSMESAAKTHAVQASTESAVKRGRDRFDCPASPSSLSGEFAAAAAATGPAVDRAKQLGICQLVQVCLDSSNEHEQDAWGAAGVVEAEVAAMRNFPDDKEVMIACTFAVSSTILFNRVNGLKAGALGGLNLTWDFYSRHMDDYEVTSLGGAIGAYFDYVDENRVLAREMGAISGIIQNIRNNFHGQYSEWGLDPVKNSLFALSSGAWLNQDVAVDAGFIPLDIQVILEHGHESKICEESMQVVKAFTYASDDLRRVLAKSGLFKALKNVLYSRVFDRGAVSLVSEVTTYMIGPAMQRSTDGALRDLKFDKTVQDKARDDGMLEALLATAKSTVQMQHFEHGGFNFNIDAAYPAQTQVYQALQRMALDNPANQAAMIKAGIAESIEAKWPTLEDVSRPDACRLLDMLGQTREFCSFMTR